MIRQVVVVALLCAASSYALAEQGRASHYGHGDGFHGRKIASGERFNALAMTAAHRTRPMGSHVTQTAVLCKSASMIAGLLVELAKLLISVSERRA
jgi:hypothetical protein